MPGDGVANAATRLNDLIAAAFSDGIYPTEYFADDYVREDRRRLIAMPDADRDGHREAVEAVLELGGLVAPHQPLAVRGERFSLARFLIEYDDGRSVNAHLIVQIIDESLTCVERNVLFDEDDFESAYETMDRYWLASQSTETAATICAALDGVER